MKRLVGMIVFIGIIGLGSFLSLNSQAADEQVKAEDGGTERTIDFDGNNGKYDALNLVTLHLNWQWNMMHTVFMPGIYKGFFAEEGIKLNIISGSGSVVAIKALAMGKTDFALASAAELLIARSKTATPVKILACLNQKGMTALWYSKESGIKIAKDFEGKKIACNPKSLKTEAAKIFLKLNGADMSKVEFVGVPKGQDMKYLLMGEADACTFDIGAGTVLLKLQNLSDRYDNIYLEDNGVVLMDLSFMVNENTLRNNPDLVARFMRAIMKSWRYDNAFPELGRKMIRRYIPSLTDESVSANIEVERFLQWRPETVGRPLGWISREVFEKTQNTLIKAGMIGKKFDLTDIFTNDYIY